MTRSITRLFSIVLLLCTHVCAAQFIDTFSDGDFTNNPTWNGTPDFIVNSSSQLQLNNTVASTSRFSAAVAAPSLDNFEWQVYVKQTFAPSGSNFGRVYLASNQSNLTGSLNGYYLQFGEAGALDAVELFRQTGLTSTSICRATNGSIATSVNLRVRVLRSNTGLWKLMIDYTGGTNFVQEASATEATYNSSAFLGVVCVYTASNANKFFYDDFYMGPEIVDTTPPSIVSVNSISATTLDVIFDEKVDPTSSQLLTNYSVNNGVGNPSSAVLQTGDKTVRLIFDQPFPNAITCQLSAVGVMDLFNNAITVENKNFLFFQPVPAELRDIIITEIFADPTPTVGLPELEFIEIYNRSNKIFDLQNWKITDGSSSGVLPSHLFFPDEYIMITATSSAAQFSSYGTVLGVSNFPTLNNSGDIIVLKDNTDAEIISVPYLDSWYRNEDKKQGGYTLELIDPANRCAEESNWTASNATNGGTPGTQNSVFANVPDLTGPKLISAIPTSATEIIVRFDEKLSDQLPAITDFTITPAISVSQIGFTDVTLKAFQVTLSDILQPGVTYSITAQNIYDCPGNIVDSNSSNFVFGLAEQADSLDIVINEIFSNPSPTVGLPAAEFVEIYNRSNKIIDLQNWIITDGSSSGVLPSHLFFPGEYIVLTSTSSAAQFTSYGTVLGVSNFPTLNNSSDVLVLKDNTDRQIDKVSYSVTWYHDDDKKQGGYTLELIDPNNQCDEENNWTATNAANGGTPGTQNSVFANESDQIGPKLISVITTSATEIIVRFDEKLRDQLPAITDFTITPEISVSQIAFKDGSLKAFQLTLSDNLQSGVTYSMATQNIYDCPGNVGTNGNAFVFGLAEQADSLDIVISEILSNPSPTVGLPEEEFVEIYNRSKKIVDLQNWIITDGSSSGVLPSHLFFPGEYIILTSASSAALFSTYGTVLGVTNFPTLNNTSEKLVLKDNTDQQIDKVSYSITWYRDEEKKQGGYTLELIDPDNQCDEEGNWKASNEINGGTPGTKNSVFAKGFDQTGPKLISAITTSATELAVRFDEKLSDQLPAINDFTITPSISVSQIAFTDTTLKAFQLTLSNDFQSGVTYSIAAQNIYDCPGNVIDATGSTFVFGLPEQADSLDIVINEILCNPSPTIGLPVAEFVEIYNRGNKMVDLKDWKITDGSSSGVLPSHLFFPGEYIVLTSTSFASQFSTYGTVLGVSNFPTLNNTSDKLVLKDNTDREIDKVSYSITWYHDDDKKQGGYTLELIDPNNQCNDESNWIATNAANGGTPGTQNSVFANEFDQTGPKLISVIPTSATELVVRFDEKLSDQLPTNTDFTITPAISVSQISFTDGSLKAFQLTLNSSLQSGVTYSIVAQNIYDCPGNVVDSNGNTFVFGLTEGANSLDIMINEILCNPSPTVGLPESEFVEIYNRSNKIVDLQNWKITDGSSSGVLPARLFFPGEYIILTSTSSALQFSSYGNVLGVENFPTLNNSGEVLVLKDDNEEQIDKVSYTDKWYRDDDKKQGGYSLERIDPSNICAEENNWVAAEAINGGTPGSQNSVFANMPDLTGPKLVSAIPINETEIIIRFDEKLSEQLPAVTDFTIAPTIPVSQIAFMDGSLKAFRLTLSSSLQPGVMYSIIAQNIYDCPRNVIDGDTNTFVFGLPEEADSLDIVINEILFNPRPTGLDFVEVYNNSQKFINLKNWSIANYESETLLNVKNITEEDFLFPPNQYIVFTEGKQIIKGEYIQAFEENLYEVANLPGLNDDSGTVMLLDPQKKMIDFLEYADDDQSIFIDDDEGVSLERISFSAPSLDKANWKSASSTAGFATPGFVNSNVRGENAVGKIVVSPEIFEPIIGQPNFTQIQYNFEQGGAVANVKILDSQGREIKKIANNATLGTGGFFRWDGDTNDGTKARNGYYVVWVQIFNADGSLNTFRKRVVVTSSTK